MKKSIQSKFEIRLAFERNTENPSRLFKSFADMIDGINSLDHIIAESVNTKVKSKIVLDDIEKGSLIGRFWNELVVSEDGQIDNSPDEVDIEEYIEASRAESFKFLAEKKHSVKDLENLKETITDIAEAKDLPKSLNYAEPDTLKLAEAVNKINESTEKLSKTESFELKSPNNEVKDIKSGVTKINIEEVEDALTSKEIINESVVFYLIKKPDFLSDSAWSFKHGTKSISVKILHYDWLTNFHSGSIPVVPGDSLQVRIKQILKYNRNGYLISEKTEIIEVIDVIHNQ
jgi:hypothetical protein